MSSSNLAEKLTHKQILFYSIVCAIINGDNRVCRVVLPSFIMNGGDVYGKLFFSRLNVFWNVPLSVAYVHRFDKQKVTYKVESRPNTLKSWSGGLPNEKLGNPPCGRPSFYLYYNTPLLFFKTFHFNNQRPSAVKDVITLNLFPHRTAALTIYFYLLLAM